MKTNKELCRLSREQLGNNVFRNRWITMMAICAMAILVDSYLSAIAPLTGFIIGPVFAVIVGGPFIYGSVKAQLECANGERWSFLHILHGFLDCFSGSMILGFLKWLFLSAWTLLLLIPGWAIAYLFYVLFGDMFYIGFLWALFGIWTAILVIPGAIKAYSYAFAFHIQCQNSEKEGIDCLRESEVLMKGHKRELLKLDIGFLGWYVVGILCLGVGILFVLPYHEIARTNFYKQLKDEQDNIEIQQMIEKAEAEAEKLA